MTHFNKLGVNTQPFQASNCGLNIKWPKNISDHHIGKPLKNIAIQHHGFKVKGEAVISNYGIEGNAVYPISSSVRNGLNKEKETFISIDFKPNQSVKELLEKVNNLLPKNFSKALKLDAASVSLLKSFTTKEQFITPENYCKSVKNLIIPVQSLRPIEEAISTVGGIEIKNLNTNFSLIKHPHIFCIGEMVNWDAPTGGFLLQGCFSMANHTAQEIIKQKNT